jgi:hypothetical protein
MEYELVPQDVRYQIEQYKNEVDKSVTYVKSLDIKSRGEAEKALDIACEAINLFDRIESIRKEITEPSRKFQAEVNRLAKQFTQNLEKVKDVVVEKVDEWKLGSEEVANLETSKVQTLELTEFSYEVSSLDDIPREYLTIDEARVKLAMKQGLRIIPGLKIRKSTKTSIRRK